jgi:hypothetical protein
MINRLEDMPSTRPSMRRAIERLGRKIEALSKEISTMREEATAYADVKARRDLGLPLSAKQMAVVLNCSLQYVYWLTSQGQLKQSFGRGYAWSDAEEFLKSKHALPKAE